jgi:hypothetical protein
MRWRSWLRHSATSLNIAGSIPDGVITIFHWHNPSGRTMALGSTQPLAEMSTTNEFESHRGHGCLCCVCCKDGSMERKVTWRTKGLKQYKKWIKGEKTPDRQKKKIPPRAWMPVCCECCVLSGRGLCDGLIPRPEESYRVWCV